MKLLIDAGNTRTKWAWLPEQPLTFEMHLQTMTLENQQWLENSESADAQALLAAMEQAGEIWLSNVAGATWLAKLIDVSSVKNKLKLVKASSSSLGLLNGYSMPAQLGSDRWCSLLATWYLLRKDTLVVTAGTAMTMDALIVGADAEKGTAAMFAGGSIQPGLGLMWRSLQQGTAQLDFDYPRQADLSGGFARNSQQAMWAGCIQAMIAPINEQFNRLQALTQERVPSLILSGGDAHILQGYLPDALSVHAIIVDNLVLKGLACLAESAQQ